MDESLVRLSPAADAPRGFVFAVSPSSRGVEPQQGRSRIPP